MGTAERREREKRERREHIVRTARRLFRTHGYNRTTVPMIAEAAELAPGTIYLYFSSKQSLYLELLHEGYDIVLRLFRAAVAEGKSARRQAGALIEAFFEFARDYPDYFDIMFFILQEGGEIIELRQGREVMQRLAERQEECKAIAFAVLRRARPGASVAAQRREVEAVWSMLAGVALFFLRDEPKVFAAMTAEAKRLVLRGIFGNE
jgi:AcrR family transcriptional regulator